MKRGHRVVHGDKELFEKLGRRDPCPCGSGRKFQGMLPRFGSVSLTEAITNVECIICFGTGMRYDHLPEFNAAIMGRIEVIAKFHGAERA